MIDLSPNLDQTFYQTEPSISRCIEETRLSNNISEIDWTAFLHEPFNHFKCGRIVLYLKSSKKRILLQLVIVKKLNVESNPVLLRFHRLHVTLFNDIEHNLGKRGIHIQRLLDVETRHTAMRWLSYAFGFLRQRFGLLRWSLSNSCVDHKTVIAT